ncbi:hypothetical protein [Paenibacillus sp. NPDC058174]|uniref:hypothetical protein n=1 Tax=Paenibacillus sp. NPDC058174 TaxID=3346366 RepID=UPI0036DC49E7
MPNYNIFDPKNSNYTTNGTNNYTQPGASVPPDSATSKAVAQYFSINAANSASLGLLGGSVNISIQIANPSNSGKTFYLQQILGYTNVSLSLLSSFSGLVTVYSGGTLTSPSAVVPANLQLGSSVTSAATTNSSIFTVSGGTSFSLYPLFPGPLQINFNGNVAIPPGQTLTVNVLGTITVLGIMGAGVEALWWEN